MWFVEDDVKKILSELPSECSYLDYKEIPYVKETKHDFIKDVIAMLNSWESIGKNKFIIFGVSNNKTLIGLRDHKQPDDNEFQNWADNIVPRPQLQTGKVLFKDKEFGYVCLLESNDYVVYEVGKTVSGVKEYTSVGKNAVLKGQAFLRQGSRNEVMMQPDRVRIFEHKPHEITQLFTPDILPPKCGISIVITLIGAWDESRAGDCNVIEQLYGKTYAAFQVELREFYSKNRGVISFSNNVWKLNNRNQIMDNVSTEVFDNQVEIIKDITCEVIYATDLYLNLGDRNEELTNQSIRLSGKKYVYSDVLRKSLFEFWAYAGNNSASFVLLSRNRIEICIKEITEKVIHSDNWKVLVTNLKSMPLLAEANPNIFLNEMELAIKNKDNGLYDVIDNCEKNVYARDFLYSLSDALGLLAMYKDSFFRAGMCLIALADKADVFLDKISTIMLPGFPQTEADVDLRKGFFNAAFMEYSDNAWRLLLQLLPNQRTSSYTMLNANYLVPANIPNKGVTVKDYWSEISGLVAIACFNANGNISRLVDLIQILDDVTENSRCEIISVLKNEFSNFLDDSKFCIWMALKDLVSNQRRFSNEEWSLSEEQLSPLVELNSKFEQDIWLPQERRLFREDQWSLLDHNGIYKDKEEKLLKEQRIAAKKVYELGFESFIRFLDIIENPKVFGISVAKLEIADEILVNILEMFEQTNPQYTSFAKAFVQEAYQNNNCYLRKYLAEEKPEKTVLLYVFLPITSEAIKVIQKAGEKKQKYYWKSVDTFGFEANYEITEYVINKLIDFERVNDAFRILYSFIENHKDDIPVQIVADVLLNSPNHEAERGNSYIEEYLINVVEKSDVADEQKVRIEWKYIDVLANSSKPCFKAIYRQFNNSPIEFMRVFSLVNKGESNDQVPPYNYSMYRLLEDWKIVPGTKENGSFDGAYLSKWITDVRAIAEKNNRIDSVEHYLGKLLFYSPASNDGLFIDKTVAKILHTDDKGHMLNGYLVEAINSRGVHNFDGTGTAEFELEKVYRDKATEAEREGFYRFGNTLRLIASFYHDNAIHNIEEAQKWRSDEN